MIDSSAKYGLYNPAFTEDIGVSMLGKMVGNSIEDIDDYKISGTSFSMKDIDIKKNLSNDKFESTTTKKKAIKGTLIGLGVLIAGLAGWKFGLFSKLKNIANKIPGVSSIGSKISGIGTSLKSKVPSFNFKNIGSGIKSFFTSIGSRVKKVFKK